MKKQLLFAVLLLCGAVWAAPVQAQKMYLTVKHVSQGNVVTDDFSLEGGIVQILNNTVSVIYSGNPTLNRTYQFDNIKSMGFRNVYGVKNIDAENFKAYFDGNILHVTATQTLGTVNVYSITGARMAGVESATNTAQINLSALPNGVYIVQAGTNTVKIVK